jgi:hypothetical protein
MNAIVHVGMTRYLLSRGLKICSYLPFHSCLVQPYNRNPILTNYNVAALFAKEGN